MTETLQQIGLRHRTDKATFHEFCDFYEQRLPRKIDRLLEVGVMHGASLRMWRDWHQGATIVGLDIGPPIPVGGCDVFQMDATDEAEMMKLQEGYGPFDVVVDDSSHLWSDQQQTFRLAWMYLLRPDGYFVMEDLHTSAWENYRGGAEISTVEYLQRQAAHGTFTVEWFDRTGTMDESVTAVVRRVL